MAKIDTVLTSLARRDPLSWGITYFDLLEGKKWEISSRKWVIEPYQVVNPWRIERYPQEEPRRMVIEKSTQAGVSTLALVKALHLATNWPVRIGYTLPRQQDTLDFVTTRVDPILRASDYLKSKLGQPDSAHAKRIQDSYLFFIEMSTEPRMMPLDALMVDEVDLSNPDNLSTVQNRMDASKWKMHIYLSTPTVAGFGIDAMYSQSDMRKWLVKCPRCNDEQELEWEINLKVEGPADNPTKVFYGCRKCSSELTPEHIQTGRWVAEKPIKSHEIVGYHIHQMLTSTARSLYTSFRDPTSSLLEFYRKRLGKPYEIGGGSIEREDILVNCFSKPYDFEAGYDGESTYYLGADQGNEIQAVVGKVHQHSNRIEIVHIELIPMERGFNRLSQLIDLYRVKRAVVDANPNRHEAMGLVKRFPGRVLIADYVEQREPWKMGKKIIGEGINGIANVAINRTSGFDSLVETIKKGQWGLPGNPPRLDPQVEILIDHVTALKRDVEIRRTRSGDIQVAVWRKIRPEHLAHSLSYLRIATEIDRGKSMKMAVIGEPKPADSPESLDYQPDKDVMIQLIDLLAEVPIEQLEDFLQKGGSENIEYTPEFPLSYKLEKVYKGAYNPEDIDWVTNWLIIDKKKAEKALRK